MSNTQFSMLRSGYLAPQNDLGKSLLPLLCRIVRLNLLQCKISLYIQFKKSVFLLFSPEKEQSDLRAFWWWGRWCPQ